MVELKFFFNIVHGPSHAPLNRTMVELKYAELQAVKKFFETLNRTMVELK